MSIFVGIGRRHPGDRLVDLLLECHGRIRRFSRLAVELGRRVDAAPDDVVDACQRCERYFTEALPLHVEDEEESLLPRLLGQRSGLDEALAAMRREHGAHEAPLVALLDALRVLRSEPRDVDRRVTVHTLADALARDLEMHLKMEEQIIFPAVDTLFSPETQTLVVQELRARRQQGTSPGISP